MEDPEAISPSRSVNWLTEILASARDRNACMEPNCTTCGALPFRKALWASAEAASPEAAAKAVADQLEKLEPPFDVKRIRFVLWELNRTIGSKKMSELPEDFAKSYAGYIYRQMLEHEEGILARRKEHEFRNNPIEVERRRAEKKAQKGRRHRARLKAKAERDAARTKDQ